MKKMNGVLLYKRMEKFAKKWENFPGVLSIDFKYVVGEDYKYYGDEGKKAKVTISMFLKSGMNEMEFEVFVSYDARKAIITL